MIRWHVAGTLSRSRSPTPPCEWVWMRSALSRSSRTCLRTPPSIPSLAVALSSRFGKRGQAGLSVRDNGIGLASGNRESIFELFTQIDSSLARAETFQPERALADIDLPGINGYELAADCARRSDTCTLWP